MSCGAFSLVALDGKEAGVFPLRCKRWGCPACGPRKARKTIARIQAGMKLGPTRFFTLTSPGGENSDASYAEFPARWKRMHQRVVRRFGRFEYAAVVEPQKRGAAHIHVVYRGPFIPQAWLSRAAAESGFGRIADIRRSHPRLMSYLAKYLTKQLAVQDDAKGRDRSTPAGPPRYFRRVRWSKNWCAWTGRAPSRQWPQWRIADVGQVQAAADARGRGFDVVELVIGESGSKVVPAHFVRWLRTLRGYRPFALAATNSVA